jgi:hypothetical protein
MRQPLKISVPYSLAGGHETGHLVLGKLDLLAAKVGQGDIGDAVVSRVSHS